MYTFISKKTLQNYITASLFLINIIPKDYIKVIIILYFKINLFPTLSIS